ncbi:hypothetical protein [Polaribacter sp. R77954]|uniref:hypothetical protein n=1 Tax=Polaribacter sp. R77954 TaxID=3093870 RepID=UPI0037C9442C
MKIMNLNSVKTIIMMLAISNMMLLSCNNPKKKTTTDSQEIGEAIKVEKDNVDIELKNEDVDENLIKTRSYKLKDRATPIVYDLDINGVVGFDDWEDFTTVNNELVSIRNTNKANTKERIESLNYRVANLRNTIPDWLQTEEVLQAVANVQKEYLELISEKYVSDDEMKENLDEVFEKFDDLKEKLDDTINQYMTLHKDAIEEFNEEIKDFDKIIENK